VMNLCKYFTTTLILDENPLLGEYHTWHGHPKGRKITISKINEK